MKTRCFLGDKCLIFYENMLKKILRSLFHHFLILWTLFFTSFPTEKTFKEFLYGWKATRIQKIIKSKKPMGLAFGTCDQRNFVVRSSENRGQPFFSSKLQLGWIRQKIHQNKQTLADAKPEILQLVCTDGWKELSMHIDGRNNL